MAIEPFTLHDNPMLTGGIIALDCDPGSDAGNILTSEPQSSQGLRRLTSFGGRCCNQGGGGSTMISPVMPKRLCRKCVHSAL
jgi:hypothetical protein